MKRQLLFFVLSFFLGIGAFSIAEGKAAAPKKTAPIVAEEKQKDNTKEEAEEYVYTSQGKTDPFVSFIAKQPQTLTQVPKKGVEPSELQKMLAILDDLKRPKTELQTIPLESISLTSILKTGEEVVGMVKGPDDAKGYFLKKGTYIGTNGGVVEEIVNEEKVTDLGKQLVRKVIIKEPYLDENQKISYRQVELKMPGGYE
jgi:Tfp pilus assembly protein PilP